MATLVSESTESPGASSFSLTSDVPPLTSVVCLVVLWFILCRHLSGEWSVNEQYNYGWFVPFFAALLFWLRWEDRPPHRAAEIPKSKAQFPIRSRLFAAAVATIALLLLFPIRLFEIANPDWRPLSWIHAAAVVALTLIYIWYLGGVAWLRHFAFPVLFILVAVPWVSPLEEPVVQGLMRGVATVAAEAMNLFGVPAQVEGNLIRVGKSLVGVNEACSGVRSLQTSLMIGLLFGELKRLTMRRRLALVIVAIAIALIANCARAIFLVAIAASRGTEQLERWHDIAGYTILGVVFLGTMAATALLRKETPKHEEVSTPAAYARYSSAVPRHLLLLASLAFCWLVAVEIAIEAWYRLHERNLVPTPQWSVRWPESNAGFKTIAMDERTRRTLRFDEGRGGQWRPNVPSSIPPDVLELLYFFRWHPGGTSALLSSLHRPDVCLPATGWEQIADHGTRRYAISPTLSVPFRHFEFRHVSGAPNNTQWAHAFYSLREDRVPRQATLKSDRLTAGPAEWTRSERTDLVLEGRRNLGQQVLEFAVVSHIQIDSAEMETEFARTVRTVVLASKQPQTTNQ